MAGADKLKRDIETMRESVRREWDRLVGPLTPQERSAGHDAIERLLKELKELIEKRDRESRGHAQRP